MPENGKARLALINASTDSVFVKMKCGLASAEFVVPAQTTKLHNIDPSGKDPIVRTGDKAYACEIIFDGALDALRTVGTVFALGYSAPIRFYDPKTATFPSLTAVGLETSAGTHVTANYILTQ